MSRRITRSLILGTRRVKAWARKLIVGGMYSHWVQETKAALHSKARIVGIHFHGWRDLMASRNELIEKARKILSVHLNEFFYLSGIASEVPKKKEWWLGQLLKLYNDDFSAVIVAAWRRLMPNQMVPYWHQWKQKVA